ncbi:MAG: carboxymuconolactone decarboxylase family protein [Gammaproteobacteria bacterium]|nr:carboxymuconolactone decarboxylase family protein [Gammaproteobacteria bacterium]
MRSILPATGADPVGAAALLGHADPVELERFVALEDAIWGESTLTPAVIESVRLHCARIRGCEFCKAVRYTAAIEDGLTETQIAQMDVPEARGEFSAEQSAALTLVDHFLRDPRKPDEERAAEIARILGTSGVLEVLIGCCAFASAELRIALGENREPHGSGVVERAGCGRAARSPATEWPVLDGPVLDPNTPLPGLAPGLAKPMHARVSALWSGRDLSPELVAACVVRSTQLLGVATDDPVNEYLVPPVAARLADPDKVRNWPTWRKENGRNEMALAEQLWIDPAGVDAVITDPLKSSHGVDGLIRVAWSLILIGQLHRLALVLQRD